MIARDDRLIVMPCLVCTINNEYRHFFWQRIH